MVLIDEVTVLYAILTFIWLEYLWELYLSFRQYKVCKKNVKVPPEIENIMSKETFDKARLYMMDKLMFEFVKDLISVVIGSVIIYKGLLAVFWSYAKSINPWEGEVAISCIWLFMLTTVTTILDLPITIYHTFVLEERYGFNKQTSQFFVIDKIKSFILNQALSIPISALAIVIIKYGGDYFFVWLWVGASVVVFLLLTIWPSYIAPLFDKYTPLPEGDLRTEIAKLATQLKFPLGQVYVVEGSKRSAHSNAYFYGLFGVKRIVLFDTLLAKPEGGGCEQDEVLAVLTHELGHWKHKHFVKYLIIMQVNLFLLFTAFSVMFHYAPLYKAVGFPTEQPVLVGLMVVLQHIMTPYNTLLSFLLTCLSRKFEFQADAFAYGLGKAESLQKALIQLYKDNLGFPIFDSLYSLWHHSHPPLLERIAALKHSKKE